MIYKIIGSPLIGQLIKEDGKFIVTPTILVGIDGDTFGLSVSDGCTIDVTNVQGKPEALEQFVLDECNDYVENKYNK